MFDIGFSKIIIISIVGIVVIGPEKLPATAKAVGILWSRLQKYIFKLKQEVNQHINIEEVKQLQNSIHQNFHDIKNNIETNIDNELSYLKTSLHTELEEDEIYKIENYHPKQCNGRYSWRLKLLNIPLWYKQNNNLTRRAQSGAARMKRFRHKSSYKNNKHPFKF